MQITMRVSEPILGETKMTWLEVYLPGRLLFIGNLSGNVGTSNVGFEVAYGGFGYVCRNQEGQDILDRSMQKEPEP